VDSSGSPGSLVQAQPCPFDPQVTVRTVEPASSVAGSVALIADEPAMTVVAAAGVTATLRSTGLAPEARPNAGPPANTTRSVADSPNVPATLAMRALMPSAPSIPRSVRRAAYRRPPAVGENYR